MNVKDFNWDKDAVLNLLYLHMDVNNNPEKYNDWKFFLGEHAYSCVLDLIDKIPERTKKFAMLFSLHERNFLSDPHKWNEDGVTDYESAIAAMSTIMNDTNRTVNDVRFCSVCGMPMCEGLMLDPYETDGGYYCSDTCARKDMTADEYERYGNEGSLFYTEWDGSEDTDEIELI